MRRKPLELLPLEEERMDVPMAVLLVAAKLERAGHGGEAAVLKLELGELLIRAGLHAAEHPGPVPTVKWVGTAGVEPAASALSRRRSTTELRAKGGKVGTKVGTGLSKKKRKK